MIPLKVKQYHKLVLSQSHYQRCLQRSTERCLTSSAIKHLSIMERSFKVKLSGRLSSLVRPVNYKLKLNPNLEDGTFKGNVEILVNVQEERSYLILHTSFLNIKQIKVFKDDDEIAITNFLEVKHLEQLVIHVADVLEPGKFKLKLDFTGDLTNKIVGFYSSTLGDKRTMVASKFQPTYARQAFPCFDEPELKATYDITLEKPASYIALSNMNEVSSIHNEITNTDAVTFATSVPMSTYLACFVICDFDHKETTINTHGIGTDFTLRLFAQKGETHKINFALDIGKRATEFYIQYYEVPFPLPKLDMIAIPDYVSGATEHWGLITYRETSFLLDPATASSKNKMSVANVIAHELAHMWFGNLVTMKWWDEVWLNEGFATYMQVKSLNALEPTWTMLDQFLTSTLHPALVIDAKLSSHPIVQSVDTPDQITAIFDSISYKKGSSILRMLEGFVGAENFRNGILAYLTKHKFGNTVQQDLLASLTPFFHSDNAGLDLKYIMDTWTKQMGYPLLTVAEGTEPGTFIVTQKRFLLQPYAESKNDSEFNYRWYVPITYKTDKGESETVLWFSDKADNFKITLNDGVAWLKLNNNQVGYYRVNYSEDLWKKLIEVLKTEPNARNTVSCWVKRFENEGSLDIQQRSGRLLLINSSQQQTLQKSTPLYRQLSISDRAHLINDVFSLAAAQVSPYPQALELLSYLSQETALVPWDAGAAVLEGLATKLHGDPAGYYLHRFVCDLVEPQYNKLSWERNDQQASVIDGLFRVRILQLATRFELPAAKSKAREMFLRWLNAYGTDAPITIEPDLRDIVYYYGMQQATMSEWDRLWQIYLEESDVHELTKLRYALAAPLNAQILQKYLDLAWDEKNVRGQDYFNVLQSIARNPVGESLVWNQVRQQWNKLVERFTLNSRYLGIMVQGITSGFKTEERLKQMETFFAQYPQAGAGAANRKAALETVYDKIAWTAHCEPSVTSWLHSHRDSRDPPSCGLAD